MNPYGKKGSPLHQKKVKEIGLQIRKKGLVAFFEYAFRINGGKKKKRYADVTAFTMEKELVEIHQVGKRLKDGRPVKREREAINDIEEHSEIKNIRVEYHTYTKIIILLVTFGLLSLF